MNLPARGSHHGFAGAASSDLSRIVELTPRVDGSAAAVVPEVKAPLDREDRVAAGAPRARRG